MKTLTMLCCLLLTQSLGTKGYIEETLERCDSPERMAAIKDILSHYGLYGDVPLSCPLKAAYRVSSPYGWRNHPVTGKRMFHTGTDMAVSLATPVYAAAAGEVIWSGLKGGYGRCVMVRHKYGFTTLYGHLCAYYVRKGERVRQGTPVGFVGSTGISTGDHLHYEVRKNGKAVCPYLPVR